METERFDALTARLAQSLSRRRSLGLLAALGAAASQATGAEAGKKKKKRKKKKPKPQPCGGACGACEACFNDACTPVAEGVACGSGKCFDGQCLTCSGERVPVDGLCARPCTENADCPEANVYCHTREGASGPRYCMQAEDFDAAQDCPGWDSGSCSASHLCVNFGGAPKCLVPG